MGDGRDAKGSFLQGIQLEEEEDAYIIPEQDAKCHDRGKMEPEGPHLHLGVWGGGTETTAL